ncbi:IS200/IS605 family transposase, partial [Nitrosococcus oceani]|uniref:IS200/IS605 family transposase n=1 Tax=Nitrosococcus oceani TaxID=1229 RepID=UPI00055C87F9
SKYDLKVHLIWVAKYRKRVLRGPVALRVGDLIRPIAMEHDLPIISGKVAREHVHVFIRYRPMQRVSDRVKWLKGRSSRVLLQAFPHLRKQFWGRHLWARGYCAISSGTMTDEMMDEYINEQEGEPIHDDSKFQIDPHS